MARWKSMYIGPKQSPCQGCKDRSVRCHGSCILYAEYRALCEDVRRQRQLRRDVDRAVADAMKRIPGKREV